MNHVDATSQAGIICCDHCLEYFDPRPENPASEICGDCLQFAVETLVDELKARGMTVPAWLDPNEENQS